METKIIPIYNALTLNFCGEEIYLMSPRIVEIEPKEDSSPFLRLEAEISQEDYNNAREAMQRALANEICLKNRDNGPCWCINCRLGAGQFVETNKIEKINNFVVDSCDTIGYYTGSRHGYYALTSSWHKIQAQFYGSWNSLNGGSEYCRIKGKGLLEIKEKLNELLDRKL